MPRYASIPAHASSALWVWLGARTLRSSATLRGPIRSSSQRSMPSTGGLHHRAGGGQHPFGVTRRQRMMDAMSARARAARVASGLWAFTVVIGVAGAVLTVVAWRDLKPEDAYPLLGLPVAGAVYA